MPAYTCPHCQKAFTAPSRATAGEALCPHCTKAVGIPATTASRWFYARSKKKYGPYTWQQLQTLAQRGDVRPDDMLLREGTATWVSADTVAGLFGKSPPAKKSPEAVSAAPIAAPPRTSRPSSDSTPVSAAPVAPRPAKPPAPRGRSFPWLIVGLAGVGLGALLAVGVSAAWLYLRREKPPEPLHVEIKPPILDKKKINEGDPPKKVGADGSSKDPVNEDRKPKPDATLQQAAEQFVARLNRHRKAAGVGVVTLDAELSRGCQGHAGYLARHLNPAKADATNVYVQDPSKAGYSVDGERAAHVAIVATLEPTNALERWMGRLLSRAPLLNPEIQTIGIGADKTPAGQWYCVVDTQRGRGEPIIVYPAPKQADVPIAFSGGPEMPENVPAGFPITATFPAARNVSAGLIEVRDPDGKAIDGFVSTPDKPLNPGQKINGIALIPKALLQGSTLYQVKASAQLDGKPWSMAWSFTTEDDVDSKGVWAKKALDKVNGYRAAAGLAPVALDAKVSAGCLKHARYLVINEGQAALLGLNAHREDPKLPGYSKEGDEAGAASDIGIGDYEPIDAIDAWMATLYHRVPLLAPNLKTIGFGCAKGRRQGWATVMNVQSGRDATPVHPVFYPAPDQTGVPLHFPISGEEPNPIPIDPDNRAGFPVTATLPRSTPLQNATGKLTTAEGVDVPCWFSSPDLPANPKHAKAQGNVVCLIARDPLKAKTTYHVQFQGSLAGKAWEKKWKFTTIEEEASAASATRAVADRVNHFRAQVGLNAVVVDETLARGCQLHAEYLAKNADALRKAKAPVNDEDPALPWFSAEGRQAARQSLIFSNAPTPVLQIDDLMGTFSSRRAVLDPQLQRIGVGCANDVGKGWRCVFDPTSGRGDARVLVYPAPGQDEVPLLGYDRLEPIKGKAGFPISVLFPPRASVRKVEAVVKDANDKDVDVLVTSPERPLVEKAQQNIVGVHPLEPWQAGQRYAVTVAAIVNGKEWRQSWQFTTTK